MLYPLTFRTIFKEKIWGGQKIKTVLGKDYGNLSNCGETWEISGVEGEVSVVSTGALDGQTLPELISEFKGELLGHSVYQKYGTQFPLLIKFIDANQDLSIQVHPNDELARNRHNSFGKTEMWYAVQADEGASLISGFNKEVDKREYLEKFESGKLMDILNKELVQTGDVFFLPAGRVHTIGEGLLIAEIQQTSDITYRIYDFDRVDSEGNKRELHVDQAVDAIDYSFYPDYKTRYEKVPNGRAQLIKCPYFATNKLTLNKDFFCDQRALDSFVIYMCLDGAGDFKYEDQKVPFTKGDVFLFPNALSEYEISPSDHATLLESYIE